MHELDLTPEPSANELEETAQWIAEKTARLRATDSDVYEETPEPGRHGLVFWIVRDPSQAEGFDMVPRPGEDALSEAAIGFARGSERPPRYPAELPFLEACSAILNPVGSKVHLHWFAVPNGRAALSSVIDQCVASGWTRRDSGPIAVVAHTPTYVEMRKLSRTRVVILRTFGHDQAAGSLDLIESDT